MDDWAKIRQLFSTGEYSKREIGRLVGVSRGTVERALETDQKETKVGDLCKELGITRQTLYRHVSPAGELRSEGAKLLSKK